MDADVRVATPNLVRDRSKRKFACNLLLLPEWFDRRGLENVASALDLQVCDLLPRLALYVDQDPQAHLTPYRLFRILEESGRAVGYKVLLVLGMDRALALLSPQDARSLLYKEGAGGLWQWQSGANRYYLIPWLAATRPPHWPDGFCMRWETHDG